MDTQEIWRRPDVEDEWLDVVAAAERHNCSTKTIWRRIKNGTLPAKTEKVDGRDGRPVVKTLIRVADLNDAFLWAVHEEHVRKLREAAPPLTAEQKRALGKVLLDHIRDREARMVGESIANTPDFGSGPMSELSGRIEP